MYQFGAVVKELKPVRSFKSSIDSLARFVRISFTSLKTSKSPHRQYQAHSMSVRSEVYAQSENAVLIQGFIKRLEWMQSFSFFCFWEISIDCKIMHGIDGGIFLAVQRVPMSEGNWLQEHTDLRDRLAVEFSVEGVREMTQEMQRRIEACGRTVPEPKMSERARLRLEQESVKRQRIEEQERIEAVEKGLEVQASYLGLVLHNKYKLISTHLLSLCVEPIKHAWDWEIPGLLSDRTNVRNFMQHTCISLWQLYFMSSSQQIWFCVTNLILQVNNVVNDVDGWEAWTEPNSR